MQQLPSAEDPEPSGPGHAQARTAGLARVLWVPVRTGPTASGLRICRTPLGERTAVAFTTPGLLRQAFGPAHAWVRLAPSAVRALTAPLGVTALTVDPGLVLPSPLSHSHSRPLDRPAPVSGHRPVPAPPLSAPLPYAGDAA